MNRSTKKQWRLKANSRAALTLLELLFVIVCLAIIIALLFPLLGKIGAQGKNVRCIANLKQIGTAVHQYAAEYQGAFPLPYSSQYLYSASTKGLSGDTRLRGFHHLIPYLTSDGDRMKMLGVFHCPASAMTLERRRALWTSGTVLWGSYSQYCGWGPKGGNSAFVKNSADRIDDEGRSRLLFIDLALQNGASADDVSNHRDTGNAPLGANALYFGGHVKWHPVQELTFPISRAPGTYLFPDPYH